MALSRKDVERARNTINTSLNPSDLRERVSADLDVVRDAYDEIGVALTELSKAYSRIDSIAAQQGTPAAVKAFRDIAAAHKDLASTLIALRAEGRATIRERLAAPGDPPQAPGVDGGGTVPPSPQEFSPPRDPLPENPATAEFPIPESRIAIGSDSAPEANTAEKYEYSEELLKKDRLLTEPASSPKPLASPLGDFLRANRSPK